jgi:hypothetical protein
MGSSRFRVKLPKFSEKNNRSCPGLVDSVCARAGSNRRELCRGLGDRSEKTGYGWLARERELPRRSAS